MFNAQVSGSEAASRQRVVSTSQVMNTKKSFNFILHLLVHYFKQKLQQRRAELGSSGAATGSFGTSSAPSSACRRVM
jgi:hypothetical protein